MAVNQEQDTDSQEDTEIVPNEYEFSTDDNGDDFAFSGFWEDGLPRDAPLTTIQYLRICDGNGSLAIFLAQLVYRFKAELKRGYVDENGWFEWHTAEICEQFGWTRRQLDTIRKHLAAKRFIQCKPFGYPATTYYRIAYKKITNMVQTLQYGEWGKLSTGKTVQLHKSVQLTAQNGATDAQIGATVEKKENSLPPSSPLSSPSHSPIIPPYNPPTGKEKKESVYVHSYSNNAPDSTTAPTLFALNAVPETDSEAGGIAADSPRVVLNGNKNGTGTKAVPKGKSQHQVAMEAVTAACGIIPESLGLKVNEHLRNQISSAAKVVLDWLRQYYPNKIFCDGRIFRLIVGFRTWWMERTKPDGTSYAIAYGSPKPEYVMNNFITYAETEVMVRGVPDVPAGLIPVQYRIENDPPRELQVTSE